MTIWVWVALNAARAAGRVDGITFVGATNFAARIRRDGRGPSIGARSTSRQSTNAEAALQTAIDVLNGEEVPFLNYFDTPKITQDNMGDLTKPVF